MTSKQIKFIINQIGNYEMNKLIPLTEVQALVLTSDECIYPSETSWIEFVNKDSNGNVLDLFIVYDGILNDDGAFIPNEKPTYIGSTSNIMAISMVNKKRMKEPYKIAEVI